MKNTNLFSKDFTLVVAGQIISLFGNSILRFALPLYLLRETGSGAIFGIVTACSFLPMIVLSFLGGILADRVNKRNIMVALDFLTAIIILVLFVAIGRLHIVPLFIVVLMLLYGISETYQPTVQASIPALVSEENILSAGAIINQIGALANLLGPIIGGMLFGAFGIIPILIISIVCFLASAIMEIFIYIPFEQRNNSIGMISIIKNDFYKSTNYIKNEKPILIKIIGLIAIFNLVLTAMLIVGIPILIVDILKMSDVLLGVSQGVLAMGGLCGGILTAVLSEKLKLSNSYYLLFLCSICVGVMAIPFLLDMTNMVCYVVMTATSFMIMGLATIFSVQMIATVQIETPPELVGKVIALMMSLAMSAQPIGQAIYGVAFDKFSNNAGAILISVMIVSVTISIVSRKIFRKIDM
ncbi:MFS transporter [Clostridium cadaveris]|uniref:MFS transporter n=1 Tax=Clostridium cadaveris TaxID=1529 RepID=UPI0025A39078|nr:MFS transporter [Clostridium cadaveris]MDM8312045.1 MFS transporter [Clostridium cadaveris]